jgi:cation diffusion facilitator family transporter
MNRGNQLKKTTLIGFIINALMSVFKILIGFFGNSASVLADGVHSFSDFLSDFIILFFLNISSKGSDRNHSYGHGKFETFATMLVGIGLISVGVLIGTESIFRIKSILVDGFGKLPDKLAIFITIASILSKEILYRYTYYIGKKFNSELMIANAWHHRSDSMSSIGVLFGLFLLEFLGESWGFIDPLIGMLIGLYISLIGIKIVYPSVQELLESSLSFENIENIIQSIRETKGIRSYHKLKTRKIGNNVGIDLHIQVDKNLTVEDSHKIAHQLELNLKKKFGRRSHIGIHVEPYY